MINFQSLRTCDFLDDRPLTTVLMNSAECWKSASNMLCKVLRRIRSVGCKTYFKLSKWQFS